VQLLSPRLRSVQPLRRIRLFVARRPLVHWLLIGLLAATTAMVVLDRLDALDSARARWGATRLVVVATHDLPPGHTLRPGDTRTERWPRALLTDDAVTLLRQPTVVAAPIAAGEPLAGRRLGRADAGPVAALLPQGTRGVTIPVGDVAVPVRPGDRVDVVATSPGADGSVVAAGAPVISVTDGAVVAAVSVSQVGAVAGAMANGTVVLTIDADPPGDPTG
jgi:pilus assembly protein CpaB